MTHRTAGEFFDPIFVYQLAPQGQAIFGRLPVHAENKFARPDEALGLTMAFEAPFHVQRIFPAHERHPVDASMAGRTADAFLYMDAMIEIDKAGKIVHASPFEGPTRARAGSYRLEHRAVRPDLAMAIHANLGGGNTGES